ncbi:RNA polymerase sigma factor [Streptomyces sp. URMC 124]|uniref:RNA polymerase sigma factor n=1 Tax=Streptomyces sp. URMC 124 TaxID=3423405 RepID=UPI003F1AB031
MRDSGRTPAPAGTTLPSERRMEIAFTAFRELHEHRWGAYAYVHTGDAEAAADITETAFDRLSAQWPHALRQPSADSYAWSLLKEHVAGWLARHRRDTALPTAALHCAAHAQEPGRGRRFRLLESRMALYAAIARLPERQCDALVLNLVIGYTVAQVADLLGVERAAARSLIGHAKRKVTAALSAVPEASFASAASTASALEVPLEAQHSGKGEAHAAQPRHRG